MGTLTAIQKFRVHAALSEKVKLEISRDEALALARCLEERQQVEEVHEKAIANLASARVLADRHKKATDEIIWRLSMACLYAQLLYFSVALMGRVSP